MCVEMAAVSREQRTWLSLKRSMDLAGAMLGLIVLSPLLALIACAIKLDSSGSILFDALGGSIATARVVLSVY